MKHSSNSNSTVSKGEFKRVKKNGENVWLSAVYTPIWKDGKVASIVKLGRDITAEKLRAVEMETQVQAINRTQAVVEFDVQGTVLGANDLFLKTMGYESLDEIVGKPHRMFCDPNLSSADYEAFWKALRDGQPNSGEFVRFAKDGHKLYLQAVYTPIILDGKVLKVVKFAQDVTVEKLRMMDFENQIEGIRQTQVNNSQEKPLGRTIRYSLTNFYYVI